MKKIAIFISHPIQYQAPIFRKLAAEPDVDATVFYFWDYGVEERYDPQFGQKVKWDIPLIDGYKHEFLKNISLCRTSARFFGEINPGVFSRIAGGRFDAVIIFGWQTASHWFAIAAGIITGTPIFLRGENLLSRELKKSIFKRALKQVVMRLLFKLASGIFYIHEENKKFYLHYGVPELKLHPVHYAIDNDMFMAEAKKMKSSRTELKAKLGIKEKQRVILFSGKIVSGKRPLDLIFAYEKLIGRDSQKGAAKPALVFIGNGPEKSELEGYVARKQLRDMYFVGFKNQTEIGACYAIGDVFVLPSGGETWGLVVNEAMCFGLPIIVSDQVACGAELVIPGENGFVFPVWDIDALVDYLDVVLSNRNVAVRMGRKSKEIVSTWSFDQNVRDIVDAVNYAIHDPSK